MERRRHRRIHTPAYNFESSGKTQLDWFYPGKDVMEVESKLSSKKKGARKHQPETWSALVQIYQSEGRAQMEVAIADLDSKGFIGTAFKEELIKEGLYDGHAVPKPKDPDRKIYDTGEFKIDPFTRKTKDISGQAADTKTEQPTEPKPAPISAVVTPVELTLIHAADDSDDELEIRDDDIINEEQPDDDIVDAVIVEEEKTEEDETDQNRDVISVPELPHDESASDIKLLDEQQPVETESSVDLKLAQQKVIDAEQNLETQRKRKNEKRAEFDAELVAQGLDGYEEDPQNPGKQIKRYARARRDFFQLIKKPNRTEEERARFNEVKKGNRAYTLGKHLRNAIEALTTAEEALEIAEMELLTLVTGNPEHTGIEIKRLNAQIQDSTAAAESITQKMEGVSQEFETMKGQLGLDDMVPDPKHDGVKITMYRALRIEFKKLNRIPDDEKTTEQKARLAEIQLQYNAIFAKGAELGYLKSQLKPLERKAVSTARRITIIERGDINPGFNQPNIDWDITAEEQEYFKQQADPEQAKQQIIQNLEDALRLKEFKFFITSDQRKAGTSLAQELSAYLVIAKSLGYTIRKLHDVGKDGKIVAAISKEVQEQQTPPPTPAVEAPVVDIPPPPPVVLGSSPEATTPPPAVERPPTPSITEIHEYAQEIVDKGSITVEEIMDAIMIFDDIDGTGDSLADALYTKGYTRADLFVLRAKVGVLLDAKAAKAALTAAEALAPPPTPVATETATAATVEEKKESEYTATIITLTTAVEQLSKKEKRTWQKFVDAWNAADPTPDTLQSKWPDLRAHVGKKDLSTIKTILVDAEFITQNKKPKITKGKEAAVFEILEALANPAEEIESVTNESTAAAEEREQKEALGPKQIVDAWAVARDAHPEDADAFWETFMNGLPDGTDIEYFGDNAYAAIQADDTDPTAGCYFVYNGTYNLSNRRFSDLFNQGVLKRGKELQLVKPASYPQGIRYDPKDRPWNHPLLQQGKVVERVEHGEQPTADLPELITQAWDTARTSDGNFWSSLKAGLPANTEVHTFSGDAYAAIKASDADPNASWYFVFDPTRDIGNDQFRSLFNAHGTDKRAPELVITKPPYLPKGISFDPETQSVEQFFIVLQQGKVIEQ